MITMIAEIIKLDGSTFVVERNNLLSLEGLLTDRMNLEFPNWGVISNSGRISFIDYDYSIKTLAFKKQLKAGMKVILKIKNTAFNFEENTGEFITDSWDYDDNSKEVTVTMKDGMEQLQSITFEGVMFDFTTTSKTMNWAYKKLRDATHKLSNLIVDEFDSLDEKTRNRLNSLNIRYPYISSNNLWAHWNNFGQATQTHIFKMPNGRITCKYLEGN